MRLRVRHLVPWTRPECVDFPGRDRVPASRVIFRATAYAAIAAYPPSWLRTIKIDQAKIASVSNVGSAVGITLSGLLIFLF